MKMQAIMYQRGVSQYRLAKLSGVSQSCISRIVAGKRNPSGTILKKIANALHVSVDDLLAETDQKPPAA